MMLCGEHLNIHKGAGQCSRSSHTQSHKINGLSAIGGGGGFSDSTVKRPGKAQTKSRDAELGYARHRRKSAAHSSAFTVPSDFRLHITT
jgi:hypothetical protein